MKDRSHEEAMIEVLRDDPKYAVALLNAVLEDGDESEITTTLRQMSAAFAEKRSVRDRPYDEVMIEVFRENPDHALALLNAILEDGDQEELMHFLPLISAAFGDAANPPRPVPADAPSAVSAIAATLRAIGLRLTVTPLPQGAFPRPPQLAESSV